MQSINTFKEIRNVLKLTSIEIPNHLRTLSENTYVRIFNSVSQEEQRELASYKEKALTAARKIHALPANSPEIPGLCQTAISNLFMIRHKQQLVGLFNGFDESINAEYFRKSFSEIPLQDRVDAVSKALLVAKEIVCPFKRKRLVQMLAHLLPEHRILAREHLVAMLAKCPGRDYENILFGFLHLVKRQELGEFIQDLRRILDMIDVVRWNELGAHLMQSMETKRAPILHHLCRIVSHDVRLNSGILAAIIRNIKQLLVEPQILTCCARLTSRATDASYIPPILHTLSRRSEAERESVVHFLTTTLPPRVDSPSLHHYLEQALTLTHERRQQILEAIIHMQAQQRINHMLFAAMEGHFMMHELEEQLANMALDRYALEVHRSDLTDCPLEVLNALWILFQEQQKHALKIRFLEEPSVDVGGPAQEFIAILVEEVCKTVAKEAHESELFRPTLRALKEEHKRALGQLGALFIFCLHSSAKYTIGKVIDPTILIALTKLNDKLITTNWTTLSQDRARFNELFCIYEAMKSTHEDDQASITRMKQYMEVDSTCLDDIVEAMREELEPCFILYNGMRTTQFPVDILNKMSAEELSDTLQGVIDPKVVVQYLHYDDQVGDEARGWLEKWLLKLPVAKLKHFLRLMTGSPSQGKRKLNIEFVDEDVKFATCTQTLTLPLASKESEKKLIEMLEYALKTPAKFNDK